MRITSDNLKAHLSRSPSPVYILFGDEPLLIQESASLIRSYAKKNGFSERLLYTFESGASFNWSEFAQEFTALSLFAEKKIIELILHSTKITEEGTKLFKSLDISDDIIFIVRAGKLTAATQKAKWFVGLNKNATLVQHWPIDKARLPRWITLRSEQKGLKLNPDAIELLCNKTEGNLLATHKEIEKLGFLFGNAPISASQLEDALTLQGRYSVFDLQDAWLKGEAKRALQIIQVLQQTGTDFTLILWAGCKLIRTLSLLQAKLAEGYSHQQAGQTAKIWPKALPLYINAASRLAGLDLSKLLQRANCMDSGYKSGENKQSWRDFYQLSLQLCGVVAR